MGAIQKSFAVGALLAAASGAWAVTATASLSNIQFQVFDLTPLDGIAPSFTFLSEGSTYAGAYTQSGLNAWDGATPASVHLTATGLDLAAASSGTGTLGSFSMTSSASDTALSSYGYASAYGNVYFQVEVGAGTLVLISANSSVAADATGAVSGTYVYGYSNIGFYSGAQNVSAGSYGYLQAYTGYGYANSSPSTTGLISATFANFGANAAQLNLQASAQSYVSTPMAPVPEPSSTAMLLSGLAVAFGLTYRRREHRA